MNELLEDLAERYGDVNISEDEVTAKMLSDRAGISMKRAIYRLETGVENGEFVKRRVLYDGHWTNAYSKSMVK
jgi:hypothetical protein